MIREDFDIKIDSGKLITSNSADVAMVENWLMSNAITKCKNYNLEMNTKKYSSDVVYVDEELGVKFIIPGNDKDRYDDGFFTDLSVRGHWGCCDDHFDIQAIQSEALTKIEVIQPLTSDELTAIMESVARANKPITSEMTVTGYYFEF